MEIRRNAKVTGARSKQGLKESVDALGGKFRSGLVAETHQRICRANQSVNFWALRKGALNRACPADHCVDVVQPGRAGQLVLGQQS